MPAKPRVFYFGARQEMVDLIQSALSRNYEVTVVAQVTGIQGALETLRQGEPDYVLVDPGFPDLDHQAFYRQLKADEELSGIQILLISDEKDP